MTSPSDEVAGVIRFGSDSKGKGLSGGRERNNLGERENQALDFYYYYYYYLKQKNHLFIFKSHVRKF